MTKANEEPAALGIKVSDCFTQPQTAGLLQTLFRRFASDEGKTGKPPLAWGINEPDSFSYYRTRQLAFLHVL